MSDDRTCYGCANCLLVDNGYSNWTVMGTDVFCIVDKHPNPGWDQWYELRPNDPGFFAVECPAFTEGDAERLDVDKEDLDELPHAHRQWLNREWGVPMPVIDTTATDTTPITRNGPNPQVLALRHPSC